MKWPALAVSLAALCGLVQGRNLVPLLAFSNCPSLPSPDTVGSHDDVDSLLTQVDIEQLHIAVVMKTKTLSFDDIAKYGGVYGEKNAPLSSLQDFLSSSASSVSTGLKGQPASELTSTLSFAMDAQPIKNIPNLSTLKKGGTQLIFIDLPEGNDEEIFRAHDSILADTKALLDQSSAKYAVFYTSDHATKPRPIKRSVSDQYTDYTYQSSLSPLCYEVFDEYNNTCIVFCFTSRYILYYTENSSMLLGNGEEGIRYQQGSCNSTESLPEEVQTNTTFAFIMFKVDNNVTDGEDRVKKSLIFAFENGTCGSEEDVVVGCGFWTMKLYAGDRPHEVTEYRRNRPNEHIFSKFSVPHSLSYSCGNCSLNKFVSVSAADSNDSFQLGGIHVQAFTRSKYDESSELVLNTVYQCQGYMDMPSWSGTVSVLLLLFFLYVSYVAAFTTQSPDTFDDPRAPTVSVENLH